MFPIGEILGENIFAEPGLHIINRLRIFRVFRIDRRHFCIDDFEDQPIAFRGARRAESADFLIENLRDLGLREAGAAGAFDPVLVRYGELRLRGERRQRFAAIELLDVVVGLGRKFLGALIVRPGVGDFGL